MSFALSSRSERNLTGVHPALVKVVKRAAELATEKEEFVITEGTRTVARQTELMAHGATRTMKSRHIPESNACRMGCAIDFAAIVSGEIRWDWPLYALRADLFKKAAAELNVAIEWGGDWTTLRDGPHVQLTWSAYP